MTQVFKKMSRLFFSSFDQNGLIQGISDIIIVRWDSGQLLSTPFLACFGCHASLAIQNKVYVYINDLLINGVTFSLDKYGYINPIRPSQELLEKLDLRQGRNTIKFELRNIYSISAQVYLFDQDDKILVSDMDGTLTKSDACGIYSNYRNVNYLHDGYHELIGGAFKNGYQIVWLTMRSLPLYKFSKDYVRQHSLMHGALIMQPQQFFPAAKKQILKKTGNVKTNMLLTIKKLFPEGSNPLVGGLGNRQNDAIAYRAAGIPLSNIFIVDTQSNVHHFGNNSIITYEMMNKQIEKYFPKLENKCLIYHLIFSVHKKLNSKKSSENEGKNKMEREDMIQKRLYY